MSGYINSHLYYYYTQQTQYGFKTDRLKASMCYIIYSDEHPRIETYTGTRFSHWWYYIYAVPCQKHYVIYVPSGTIITEFSIDLE